MILTQTQSEAHSSSHIYKLPFLYCTKRLESLISYKSSLASEQLLNLTIISLMPH